MAGIDLGTTNSAIATMENGTPRVIKLSPTEPLLPSVVFIDGRGATFLGAKAREAMLTCDESEGAGYTAWKKRMGQDDQYQFTAARKSLTAPELSALIIGELLRVYRRDMKEDLLSCVVTVPAKFDHSAYSATNKAAELARLKHHPLLQEPIAAALAYGFTSGDQRANWMVFDLGGGTLDISLMAVREGRLVVLKEGQEGDPNLGGSAFDREFLDFVLGSADAAKHERFRQFQPDYAPLRKQYRLEHFSERTHRTAWNRLLLACEEAKIALSKRQEAIVELDQPLCNDDNGREVRVEVHVTRTAYEKIIASDIERAVSLCETLLKRNRMTGKDLDQLIPIGGPMKTPYIQQVLQERLKLELKMAVDPMTAVALGAALHSETIEIPGHLRPKPSPQGVSLRLEYEPTSKQSSAPVGGVIENATEEPSKLRVEVRRLEHPWASGHVPVDETGRFMVDLPLVEIGRPYQSRFTTQVIDSSGQVIATAEEPKIWHPFPKVDAVLANTLSVATVGNQTGVLVAQGERLPARSKSNTFELARPLRKGSRGDMLNIPVIQAVRSLLGPEDTEHADCHVHVGSLIVKATDERITMDLPRGTEIELTMEVNESQQIKVLAYVPLLNEEFEGEMASEPYGLSIEDLEIRFSREEERLKTVREIHRIKPDATVAQVLEMVDRQQTLVNIQQQLVRAREGESAAMSKALKLILELAATINTVWPVQTRARVSRQLSQLRQAATPDETRQISNLEAALGRAGDDPRSEELRQIESEVSDLDLEIRHRPFYTLLLYVLALGGLRVTAHQHQVHQEAMEYAEKLMVAGAPKTLTVADIERIEAMNRRIREAYPDLEQHVKRYLEENRGMHVMDSFGTSLKKRQ